MKKCWIILVLCLVLTGCRTAETFETLGNVQHEPDAAPAMGTVVLSVPDSAVAEVFADSNGAWYDCEGYTLILQTLSAGDFQGTVQTISGFSADALTVMETVSGQVTRYDWAWSAVSDDGEVVCRAAVLDDGNYHYCLCAIALAEEAGPLQEEWNSVFYSFKMES